jgi:hypothetical protein
MVIEQGAKTTQWRKMLFTTHDGSVIGYMQKRGTDESSPKYEGGGGVHYASL